MFLSGCILAHLREATKELGVTPNDRKSLINKEVKDLHYALQEGHLMRALRNVDEDYRYEMKDNFKATVDGEKIVDFKIEYIDFSGDAYNAEVELKVRYYKIPTYIVETRLERELWVYNTPSGWKVISREFEEY